ncbi:MAG TPA: cobalamin-dependent protein [Myxococcales bacterium]|jgi:methylmalonyl-CoA mutase C-terminal domain/subunit|nr:cobalamin-dependent protein [Myxococcales bacterium]
MSTASQRSEASVTPSPRVRVLVAKPGLDGHDRGARVIAAALRDAGMEVVYTGLRASVPAIAAAAVQEDVDVIGLSILSGAHESICRRLREELDEREALIPIVVGGIIPAADREKLEQLGVAAVFGPESPLAAVVEAVRSVAAGAKVSPSSSGRADAGGGAKTGREQSGIPATRLDHSAICVRDIEAAIALIEELLGQKVAHKEFVPAQKVHAAFFDFPNGASLELVAPEGNEGLEKFLAKRGDALHHLALRVRDLDALLKRLDARGVPLIDKVSRPGARGHKVAFLHPKAFGGTLLELVEAHEESHEDPSRR